MNSYINKFYRIAIGYPSGWTVKFIDRYAFLTMYFMRHATGGAPFIKLVAAPIVPRRNTMCKIEDYAHKFAHRNKLTMLRDYETQIGRDKIDCYAMEYLEKHANNLITRHISFLRQDERGTEYQILCCHREKDIDNSFNPSVFDSAVDGVYFTDIAIQTTCSCGSRMIALGNERYRCDHCEKVMDYKPYKGRSFLGIF